MSDEIGRSSTRAAEAAGRMGGGTPPMLVAGAAGVAALGAAALYVQRRVRQAERDNPPVGDFVEVDGVRLHYVERGRGQPVVMLHGNGALFQEVLLSGIVDLTARKHRVIVFDRPGYGYSERPRGRSWTPEAQARLFRHAFDLLGIERPVVLGHSWGAMVAMALGLEHRLAVKSLVLLSGYYYPSLRLDVPIAAQPAIPVLGDLMRYTVSPIVTRLMWRGILRKLFGPNSVPERFGDFPVWMALRPGQMRAAAAEAALMIPAAARLSRRYGELRVPAAIMAGGGDRMVDTFGQSERLHHQVPASTFRVVPEVGHMIHHIVPRRVLAAIDEVATVIEPERLRRRISVR